ncbi:MAG: caspase family protein [Nanoarchaeota archaeon]|nr:caspase family protein [Nanoarchaeota archaeon]
MKKLSFVFLIFISIIQSGFSAENKYFPDWYLNPTKEEGYIYAVGISDINGSFTERMQQSFDRAMVNLWILLGCEFNGNYRLAYIDNSEYDSISILINKIQGPSNSDVKVGHVMISKDEHVFTEVKIPVSNAWIYNKEREFNHFELEMSNKNKDAITESLVYSCSAKQHFNYFHEWYSYDSRDDPPTYFENIVLDSNSKFDSFIKKLRGYQDSSIPDWFLKVPESNDTLYEAGCFVNGNFHLANILSTLNMIYDLAYQMGYEFESELGNDYQKSSMSFEHSLENIEIIKRQVGINKEGDYIVFTLGAYNMDKFLKGKLQYNKKKHQKLIKEASEKFFVQKPKINRPKFPADLQIESLEFLEPNGNHVLDHSETGKVLITLTNRGRGNAYGIEVKLMPVLSAKNLTFTQSYKIDTLSSNKSTTIKWPITADEFVQSGDRQFRIEITESNGFDADPAIISFQTQALVPPDLQIKQVVVDDNKDVDGEGYSYGNGNSIIEPGESIEVTAYVQNFGEGIAENVRAEVILNSDNPNITYTNKGQIYTLGDIESGDYKPIEFYFYTSRRFDEETIPISVTLKEVKGKYDKTIELGLKAGKRTTNVLETQIAKIRPPKSQINMREMKDITNLSDVDQNIPKTKMDGSKTLAVIIGIEEYKYAPSVDFAANDAQVFYQYIKNVFGIPERNIYYRINDGATAGEFAKIFSENGWIERRIKENESEILIYYSGHGAPDLKSKKGFLIPSDIDPNYAETGYSLDKMYESLARMQAKSVTVFIDACFSGESRSQEMLIAGIRPISVQIQNPILTSENMVVLTASTGNQYSTAYFEQLHGLFTYYLLKGLRGDAAGNDKCLTLDKLFDYLKVNVSNTAGFLDKEQTPTIIGRNQQRQLICY